MEIRAGKKMSAFLFIIIFLICGTASQTRGTAAVRTEQNDQNGQNSQTTQTEHEWIWNVLVFPPEGGWDSEAGRSVSNALSGREAELSESGSGAGGHDIRFVRLPEIDETSALRVSIPVNTRTVAVMSFAGAGADSVLVERLGGGSIPLFLAGGEDVLIDRGGRPLVNVFALDLFRDYRCGAFSLYAKKTVSPEAHVALAASRFTLNQEREAKICYDFLEREGFVPMPFWVDASVRDAFFMLSEEIKSAADGVVITFVGGMGAREIWRNFMRARSAWRVWNCAFPDESYLSYRGMLFADQNLFLKERGGFLGVKRRLWGTRALSVEDIVSGGRAEALTDWLTRGIAFLPQPVDTLNRPALLQALARVRGIPFGSQTLNIAPGLHRPEARQVYIAEVREHGYTMLDSFSIQGLPYIPEY